MVEINETIFLEMLLYRILITYKVENLVLKISRFLV